MTLTTELPRTITCGLTITTKFLGPTNYKGSRVSASHKRDNETTYRAIVDWRHDCDTEQNHQRAAQALLNKLNADRKRMFVDLGIEPPPALEIVAAGWDNDNYFFLAALP